MRVSGIDFHAMLLGRERHGKQPEKSSEVLKESILISLLVRPVWIGQQTYQQWLLRSEVQANQKRSDNYVGFYRI